MSALNPKRPPKFPTPDTEEGKALWARLIEPPDGVAAMQGKKYLHWDDLRYREPPAGLEVKQWWWLVRQNRHQTARTLPLDDMTGRPFTYTPVPPLEEAVHRFDRDMAGSIELPDVALGSEDRARFVRRSLEEEAITSSLIEGAATTRDDARELLRSGRNPTTTGERMVFNNFRTMQRIRDLKGEPFTPSLIFELHRLVTEGTMKDPSAAGRLRTAEEDWVVVEDIEGNILHTPPPAASLKERMNRLCAFANGTLTGGPWLHPVLRAMILHFVIGHDHPFVDGNGRTARALFYWSMLRNGYWLSEYVSISEQILGSYTQYGRSYRLTETDEGDLTYFLIYHAKVLRQAVDAVHKHVRNKAIALRETERLLGASNAELNGRQRHLLSHALRHPGTDYTFKSHAQREQISLYTARTDLITLADRNLLIKDKRGKSITFIVPRDLERRMKGIV